MKAGHRLDNVHYDNVAQQRQAIDKADRNSCPAMSSLQSWEIHQYEAEAAGVIVAWNCHNSEEDLSGKISEKAKGLSVTTFHYHLIPLGLMALASRIILFFFLFWSHSTKSLSLGIGRRKECFLLSRVLP